MIHYFPPVPDYVLDSRQQAHEVLGNPQMIKNVLFLIRVVSWIHNHQKGESGDDIVHAKFLPIKSCVVIPKMKARSQDVIYCAHRQYHWQIKDGGENQQICPHTFRIQIPVRIR